MNFAARLEQANLASRKLLISLKERIFIIN